MFIDPHVQLQLYLHDEPLVCHEHTYYPLSLVFGKGVYIYISVSFINIFPCGRHVKCNVREFEPRH